MKKILLNCSKTKSETLEKRISDNAAYFVSGFEFFCNRRFLPYNPNKYDYIITDKKTENKKNQKKYIQANEKTLLFELYLKENYERLTNKNFTILSDDCWSGFIYKYLGIKYNCPFIWTSISNSDFIKLCNNLDYYLSCQLTFPEVEYPNFHGMLGDIAINFSHYKTKENALEKWNRRLKRFNKDNLLIKMTSHDKNNQGIAEMFETLPFQNKILFTEKKTNISEEIYMNNYNEKDYIGFSQYVHSESFKFFDLIHWLDTGERP